MDKAIRSAWHFSLLSAILLQLFACGGGHDGGQEEQTYRIGGTVSGLSGSALVLQNNGDDDLTIEADGTFSFPTRLMSGSDYLVTIATQPSEQNCTVVNGTGTLAQGDATQVIVSCPLEAVTPEVSAAGTKLLRFAWNDHGRGDGQGHRVATQARAITGLDQVAGVDPVGQMDGNQFVHLGSSDVTPPPECSLTGHRGSSAIYGNRRLCRYDRLSESPRHTYDNGIR